MDLNDPKNSEAVGYLMSNAGDRQDEVLALARKMPNIQALRRSPELKDIMENNSMIRARKKLVAEQPAQAPQGTMRKSLKR